MLFIEFKAELESVHSRVPISLHETVALACVQWAESLYYFFAECSYELSQRSGMYAAYLSTKFVVAKLRLSAGKLLANVREQY